MPRGDAGTPPRVAERRRRLGQGTRLENSPSRLRPVPVLFGGGSDGNFTGALGLPTLDGLGPCGDGAHTHDEYILYSSLVPRARLLAGLLETLDVPDE